jgi:hypothetical protein
VSVELGYVEALNDNCRQRLPNAVELAGPDCRGREIFIAMDAKPVVVNTDFAFRSPELSSRMETAAR